MKSIAMLGLGLGLGLGFTTVSSSTCAGLQDFTLLIHPSMKANAVFKVLFRIIDRRSFSLLCTCQLIYVHSMALVRVVVVGYAT